MHCSIGLQETRVFQDAKNNLFIVPIDGTNELEYQGKIKEKYSSLISILPIGQENDVKRFYKLNYSRTISNFKMLKSARVYIKQFEGKYGTKTNV